MKTTDKNIITLIYIIYICIVIIIFSTINIDKGDLMLIAWISNITYVIYVFGTYKISKDIFNFSIILMTFIFLFCNGQIFLYSLGVNTESFLVFQSNTKDEIVRATTYFLFSFLLMGLGMIVTTKKVNNNYKCTEKFNNSIKYVALILFIASIVPYFYVLISKVIIAVKSGYGSLYNNAISLGGALSYISGFFIPSILLLLYSYRKDTKKRKVLMLICIIVAILNLVVGTRAEPMSIIVILIVYYNRYINKIKGKSFAKLFVIFLIIVTLIPTIAKYRSNRESGIKNMMEEVINNENNPIIQTISELGATMNAWCLTDKAVPSKQDFKYGESYISSIGMIIPSFLLGGYSFADNAALDIWLQNIWNMSYGPGFNIFAETYYNFGWYIGIGFSFVLGLFYGKVFNLKSKNENKNALLSILSMIFLYNSMLIARFPFHSTIRNLFYMYLLIYLAIILLYNYKNKGEKNNE